MIAFIGLGNPGDKYANTKHNAGFWVVDELARRQKLSFKPGKGPYVFAQHKRREVLLVKPTTGMNRSGNAVKEVANLWDILPSDIHVILDDVDLPLPRIVAILRVSNACPLIHCCACRSGICPQHL